MKPSWSVSNPSSDGRGPSPPALRTTRSAPAVTVRTDANRRESDPPAVVVDPSCPTARPDPERESRRVGRRTSVRDLAWCQLIGPGARRSRSNHRRRAKKGTGPPSETEGPVQSVFGRRIFALSIPGTGPARTGLRGGSSPGCRARRPECPEGFKKRTFSRLRHHRSRSRGLSLLRQFRSSVAGRVAECS